MYENEYGINNGMDNNKDNVTNDQTVNNTEIVTSQVQTGTDTTSSVQPVSTVSSVSTESSAASSIQSGTSQISSGIQTGANTSSTVSGTGFTMSNPRYSDYTSGNRYGTEYGTATGNTYGSTGTGYGSTTGSANTTYGTGSTYGNTTGTANTTYGAGSTYSSTGSTYGSTGTGYGATTGTTSGTYGTGSTGTGYGSATGTTYGSTTGATNTYGTTTGTTNSTYGTGSTYGNTGSTYGSIGTGYGTTTGTTTGTYGTGSTYGTTTGTTNTTYGTAGSTYGSTTGTTNTAYGTGSTYANSAQSGYNRYAGTTPGSNNNTPNQHKSRKEKTKKSGKAVIALAMVAVLLVGTIGGGAGSYYLLNKRIDSVQESVDKQAKNNKTVEVQDKIELNKNDKSDDIKEKSADKGKNTDNVTEAIASDGKMTTEQVVENGLSSVVAITNYGVTEIRTMWGNFQQDSESAGSGVVIGQTDSELLILTNYHVVEDSKTLSVVFSWEEDEEKIDDADIVTAVIKDYDEGRDIAVIAIPVEELSDNALSQVTVAPIGSSDDLNLGEQVVVIGNALGYGQSVTTGIVSALNRKIGSTDYYGNTDENIYIQTDAAINPGNSGGAMFNMYGELVGINSAKIGGAQVDSVGYAIPISDVTDEIESMMNQETRETVSLDQRGYLGVSIVDVTEEISETYGLPIGVYVSAVDSGYGADKAGIKQEDVITAVNGKTVTTGTELKQYLSKYSVGETVTVTVSRADGKEYKSKDIEVTLSENPNAEAN